MTLGRRATFALACAALASAALPVPAPAAAAASSASATASASATDTLQVPRIAYRQRKLANGLTVLSVESHASPTVSVQVCSAFPNVRVSAFPLLVADTASNCR